MSLRNQTTNVVSKKKMVSVNFNRGLFSLLDFLTLEHITDNLSQNVGKELTLYAAACLRRVQISHYDLAMQAMVWLCVVWFRVIWFGAVHFSASYMNIG
jgi:hypothetical protein